LPDSMPPDALPFNKKNPVDWNTGKHLVQFEPDAAVAAEAEEVLPPENPTVLGSADEGTSDDALTDTYDPEDADQDGLSLWVLVRERYDDAGTMKLYSYYRKLTWPAAHAPVVSAETRVLVDEPVAHPAE